MLCELLKHNPKKVKLNKSCAVCNLLIETIPKKKWTNYIYEKHTTSPHGYNAQVTMVELDKTVMEAVREHMPSVAGGALDCKGERSKVFDTIFF